MTRTTCPTRGLPLALALAVIGCGATTLPAEKALPEDAAGDALRPLLARGQRVVLREAPACDAVVAPELDLLVSGKGTKLAETPSGQAPSLFRVDRSLAHLTNDDGAGFLAVRLIDDAGVATWVRMELGRPFTCLVAADDAIVAASKLAGKKVVFAPWQASCARMEADGVGAASTLLENEATTPLTVSGLASLAGDRPWVGLERGTVRVPYQVLRDCFADAKPGGEATPTALALIHTVPGRCVRGDDGGKEHVECRSTVGVWEGGPAEGAQLSFRLVRRTLGPVHFTDGRPVDGKRYARTVVAVATGRPQDERARALYATIEASIARTFAEGDGSVRVASTSDPKVGYRLHVDATDLRIGELDRRQIEGTSTYQDGERDVPNPEYAKAEAKARMTADEVESAKRHYADQQQEYEKNKETIEAARQTCLQACDVIQNAQQQAACKVGCQGGSAIGGAVNGPPNTAEIDTAQQAAQQAREALASTPRTVKEPIMKPWTYGKTVYSRSVSASLRLTVEPRGEPARTLLLPLSLAWDDYEVQADGRHNVPGHAPDRGPIDHAESIVPWLAQKAGQALAEKLRAVLEQAEIEEAKKALAGTDQGKPGFEAVDAKALEVAGPRLRQAAQRGHAHPSAGSSVVLPSEAVVLAAGDCLLAVAVAEDASSSMSLTLSSDDGTFADLRGKRYAVVEACQSELLPGKDAVRLNVHSASDGPIRWGLYRTSMMVKKIVP